MTAPLHCTATFEIVYTLLVTQSGSGSGTINPLGGVYPRGATVTITAMPNADSIFTGWSGDCSGTASSTQITVDKAHGCSAAFILKNLILKLNTTGNGTGRIVPRPNQDGKGCDTNCSEIYVVGTVVSLMAIPDFDSAFSGWSGDCSGTTTSLSITMSEIKSCTATFGLSPLSYFLHPVPRLLFPSENEKVLGTTIPFRFTPSAATSVSTITYDLCLRKKDPEFVPSDCAPSKIPLSVAGIGIGIGIVPSAIGFLLLGVMTILGRLFGKRLTVVSILIVLTTGLLLASCGQPLPPVAPNEMVATRSGLESKTTYYWKVVAKDISNGSTAESDVRSFITE